jgi:hypothetical protein
MERAAYELGNLVLTETCANHVRDHLHWTNAWKSQQKASKVT